MRCGPLHWGCYVILQQLLRSEQTGSLKENVFSESELQECPGETHTVLGGLPEVPLCSGLTGSHCAA